LKDYFVFFLAESVFLIIKFGMLIKIKG